ncbi:hypothetical protein [Pelosinus baikalensis]|uniref:Uncharacterized protein n=1 Tax=Pelosinus baikalensis TaxID=2892015 RepID=A0ABS8HWT3_9FIRM|nr:hypothetical protein [Pelosinus baikalensis]MCC5467614.1 hypothetical protein [Pelosinus baikalensis]
MTSEINTEGNVTMTTMNSEGTQASEILNVVTTRKVREKFAKAQAKQVN